jgi:hypothetical protein
MAWPPVGMMEVSNTDVGRDPFAEMLVKVAEAKLFTG